MQIAAWLGACNTAAQKVLIRINDADTIWHGEDLALTSAVKAACVMRPKCEAAEQVAAVLAHLTDAATVLPLIETEKGSMQCRRAIFSHQNACSPPQPPVVNSY